MMEEEVFTVELAEGLLMRRLRVRCRDGALISLDIDPVECVDRPPKSELACAVQAQLLAYAADGRHVFSLPLTLEGTVFQRRVWQALCEIPAGTVLSYGELARRLNTSSRAVGNACRANPLPIVVPCHRVVAAHGLGGYAGAVAGAPLALKRKLLLHESSHD